MRFRVYAFLAEQPDKKLFDEEVDAEHITDASTIGASIIDERFGDLDGDISLCVVRLRDVVGSDPNRRDPTLSEAK